VFDVTAACGEHRKSEWSTKATN